MKITGQYDNDGTLYPYTNPIDVYQLGDQLRDKETGIIWAIKDCNDWISYCMRRNIGIRRILKVEDD